MKLMLDHSAEMEKSVRRLNQGKNYFQSEMQKLGLRTFPSYGNFMHVAFGAQQAEVFKKLDTMVLYRKDFAEPGLKGFSRFSAATETQLKPLVVAIQSVIP
jgi:histidinol-phosphate aminotransferase